MNTNPDVIAANEMMRLNDKALASLTALLVQEEQHFVSDIYEMRTIQDFAKRTQDICHSLALRSGWWDEYKAMPEQYRKHFIAGKMALVHSEVSEAVEGHRKGKMDDHLPHRPATEVELADAVIRIMDIGGILNLNIMGALFEKLAYNQQRADHKPEARAAEGGKSY